MCVTETTRRVHMQSNDTHEHLCVQLDINALKSNELVPYWNNTCDELSKHLWLPSTLIKTNSTSFITESCDFWHSVLTPVSPIGVGAKVYHTPLELVQDAKVITTKKIRIYPQCEDKYHQMLCVYRRAYNLAVEKYKTGAYKDVNGKSIDIRPEIRSIIKYECDISGSVYDVNVIHDAVRKAGQTFSIICGKNKKLKGATTGFSEIHFKSRKGKVHTFTIDKMPKGLSPCVMSLGKVYVTESVPEEAIGKQVAVTYDHGRWYMNVQQHIEIQTEIQGEVRCVAIDPGSRTFGTCYSPSEVTIVGDAFAKDVLLPLAKKMRSLFSMRDKIYNQLRNVEEMPQWAVDQLRYIDKELNRIECKKQDKIRDLHHRFAYYLVQNYDVIFLPTFETSNMVQKKNTRRRLNRVAVNGILSLQHYKFKQVLKWYAKKYGKVVVDVNESYTSKTRSWDGVINDKLGSAKIIKDDHIVVDRDVNAARGIYIKQLTR